MKAHLKTWIFYTVMLALFAVFTYILFQKADSFGNQHHVVAGTTTLPDDNFELFRQSFLHNVGEPAAMLLLQIISILLVSRLFGFLFIKLGQPTVIGEILAGIVLGPSLFGYYYPGAFHFLFAPESLGNLYIISQIGLVLFMFTIGMELDLSLLRQKMDKIYVISHASIIIPYFFGMLLAYFLYQEFAAAQTAFLPFALFIGISMSITAFPVLARIVQEKRLSKSHLGIVSIASAAINDVTAWCVLAAVIAIAKTGSVVSSLYTIGISVAYVLVMLLLVRPFLKRVGDIYRNSEVLNKSIIAFLLLVLITSSWLTEIIGIHALFGAFLAGVIMPQLPDFRKLVIEKIEDVSVTLLLPLFFVFTGLRTQIGLLNTPYLWSICGLIVLVAVVGKFAGSAFPARILGETWKDSLSIGVLMNTRGLMELIVLNIGYEMGVLPPHIFVMLVIMAVVTTFMTSPLLSLINWAFPEKSIVQEFIKQQAEGVFKALISVGNPESGKSLVNVAKTVLDGSKNSLEVTVLHITPGADTNPIYGEQFSVESFRLAKEEADSLQIPIETDYRVCDNIESGIVKCVNQHNYDFLLVGAGVSLSGIPFFKQTHLFGNVAWLNRFINKVSQKQVFFYPGSLIRDKTRYFIENSNCSVGVFVNRGFSGISSTIVMLDSETDDFLLRYSRRLLRNNPQVVIHIVDPKRLTVSHEPIKKGWEQLREQFSGSVKLLRHSKLTPALLQKYSFMLISYQTWNRLSELESSQLASIPSTLIINKKASRFHKSETVVIEKPHTEESIDPVAENF